MAISERAHAHHEQLFPGRVSTLATTDPELIEVFDNFAFDEVLMHVDLDVQTRLMVQLASMIAAQAVAEYRITLGAALTVGVSPVQAKEVLYQAVPYVGMAKVFDFLHATNDVLTEHGVALPLPPQATTSTEDRLEQGKQVQARIVGGLEAVERMHSCAPADEQHIQRALSGNCFGDHVSRGGLDLATRELLTVAMLATLGGCEAQLAGHVAANLRVGNDRARLLSVLSALLPWIGYPRTLNALRLLDEGAPPAPVS